MTPLRQQRAQRAMLKLHFELLYPKAKIEKIDRPGDYIEKEISSLCFKMGFTIEEVRAYAATPKTLVFARYIIANHLMTVLHLTSVETGKMINRNHSTTIRGVQQYRNLTFSKDKTFLGMVKKARS